MKDFYVADAPRFENAVVTSFFALQSMQARERRGGGGQYLALVLMDRTGSMDARMWEEFAEALGTCSEGCYVKVQGQVQTYGGRYQIVVQRMRPAREDEIDRADYVPHTRFDVEVMWAELRGYVTEFANADLRRLVLAFLDDPEIAAAYKAAPAARRLHHAWIGGLLEHVLALVRVCAAMAPFYPEVDSDLLVTGAVLHDIGKVRELAWERGFQYTTEGELVGHISIAQGMLREKLAGLPAFPERLRVLVEHMIVSHHGKLEFGSPKLPMTPEALLLSALDDLEAKFEAMRREFAAAEANGRAAGDVTDWVRSMERPLLNSRAYLAGVRGVGESSPEVAIQAGEAEPDKAQNSQAAAVQREETMETGEVSLSEGERPGSPGVQEVTGEAAPELLSHE